MRMDSITSQGMERTYYYDRPLRLLRGPAPVIFLLHGGDGDGEKIAAETGILNDPRSKHFVTVCPNALHNAGGNQWTDGRSTTASANYDDSVFISDLLASLVSDGVADPKQTYIGGSSSGGMMTLKMACVDALLFTAYCAVISNMPVDLLSRPSQMIRLLRMVGTGDPCMPYGGGEITEGATDGVGVLVLSSDATTEIFQVLDNLGAPVVTDLPVIVEDGTSVVENDYGLMLMVYEIINGGHMWPGGTQAGKFGLPTGNLNGTDTMLKFFGFF